MLRRMARTVDEVPPPRLRAPRIGPPGTPSSRGQETTRRLVQAVPPVVVVACCAFVLWQLRPDLLFENTTPNGGDMGAHVWFPAFMRDHLLTHWRLAGWTMDNYAGFPAGQYYFPLPALAIVALSWILPYNVAFKLVTVAGPVALPAAAYAFARGIRLPRPTAPLAAVTSVAFLFFWGAPGTSAAAKSISFNQGIMGGNIKSTLSGEYSFAIALACGLFCLGVLGVALRERRYLALAAALLAATVLSHVVVGIFVVVGAVVLWLFHRPGRTAWVAAAVGGVGALLTSVWTVPFAATLGYTTSMRYSKLREYVHYLFPRYFWWVGLLALVAIVVACVRFERGTLALATLTAVFGLVFRFWPESVAWNLRFLPFWYVGGFLLAAAGGAQVVRGVVHLVDWSLADPGAGAAPADATRARVRAVTAAVLVAVVAAGSLWSVHHREDQVRFWVDWNYRGYQDTSGVAGPTHRPKSWLEYHRLIETMATLPPGRALWEGGQALDAYGTPLALELLPYWTHGRIASMEGLYFESAATTPYHFLAVAALSGPGNASNPVRGLSYRTDADFELGVSYLQLLGVRYYMAYSADAKQRADASPGLRLLTRVPDLDKKAPLGWNVYEVIGSSVVAPLRYEPVVATGPRGARSSKCFRRVAPPKGVDDPHLGAWECLAAGWFDDPAALERPLAASGPASWQHTPAGRALAEPFVALPEVTVRGVRLTQDSVRFRVSRPGVPVLVKVSAFPNWEVHGAGGPYRVTPNLMVVVPTQREVRLGYGRTVWEWAGIVATLLGVVGLVVLPLWAPRRRWREREPTAEGSALR